eukprot:1154061-Pelagomonas_calceolata.AAC.4
MHPFTAKVSAMEGHYVDYHPVAPVTGAKTVEAHGMMTRGLSAGTYSKILVVQYTENFRDVRSCIIVAISVFWTASEHEWSGTFFPCPQSPAQKKPSPAPGPSLKLPLHSSRGKLAKARPAHASMQAAAVQAMVAAAQQHGGRKRRQHWRGELQGGRQGAGGIEHYQVITGYNSADLLWFPSCVLPTCLPAPCFGSVARVSYMSYTCVH